MFAIILVCWWFSYYNVIFTVIKKKRIHLIFQNYWTLIWLFRIEEVLKKMYLHILWNCKIYLFINTTPMYGWLSQVPWTVYSELGASPKINELTFTNSRIYLFIDNAIEYCIWSIVKFFIHEFWLYFCSFVDVIRYISIGTKFTIPEDQQLTAADLALVCNV